MIVFWNVKRKNLSTLAGELAHATQADVLVLNESVAPVRDMLDALRATTGRSFVVPTAGADGRFHCFVRDPIRDMSEIYNGFRVSVRKLALENGGVLLGLVHGLDIRNHDAFVRQDFVRSLALDVQCVKSEHGGGRVVLIGDFNMNPYDAGMNLPTCLNAMMTKKCVSRGRRTYKGDKYDFYYNPMWGLFGDVGDGPSGTVYNMSNQGPYGWSMLDQVIIHHSVVSLFEGVRIMTYAGSHRLIDAKGRLDKRNASDHLPIVVNLKG